MGSDSPTKRSKEVLTGGSAHLPEQEESGRRSPEGQRGGRKLDRGCTGGGRADGLANAWSRIPKCQGRGEGAGGASGPRGPPEWGSLGSVVTGRGAGDAPSVWETAPTPRLAKGMQTRQVLGDHTLRMDGPAAGEGGALWAGEMRKGVELSAQLRDLGWCLRSWWTLSWGWLSKSCGPGGCPGGPG